MKDTLQKYSELSVTEFAEQLASKAPVPGGGGVSALVGALSASLCSMVGNLTVGKKKYAAAEEEIRSLMEKAESLRRDLLQLIEEDAAAFAPLSRAYSLPKETEEERSEKARVMEQCLRDAADVPFRIMQKVCDVIGMIRIFREKGSVLAVSDAGVSAALASAALRSAALNVLINTRMMKDRTYAESLNVNCQKMLDTYVPAAEAEYRKVEEQLH